MNNNLVAELVGFAGEEHGHVALVGCQGHCCGAAPPLHRAVARDGRRTQHALIRREERKAEG